MLRSWVSQAIVSGQNVIEASRFAGLTSSCLFLSSPLLACVLAMPWHFGFFRTYSLSYRRKAVHDLALSFPISSLLALIPLCIIMADATRRAQVASYDLAKSCLLVIDMQRQGSERKTESVQKTSELEQRLLPLIRAYKAKGLPVFYPQNVSSLAWRWIRLTARQGYSMSLTTNKAVLILNSERGCLQLRITA